MATMAFGMSRVCSEAARQTRDDSVVGEGRVAWVVGGNVGYADFAVPLHRPRGAHVEKITAANVHEPRLDGDHVTGAAEPVAAPEGIADGDAFHAASEAEGQAAQDLEVRRGMGEASAPQVLVGGGDDALSRCATAGVHTGCVLGAEVPG